MRNTVCYKGAQDVVSIYNVAQPGCQRKGEEGEKEAKETEV